MKLERYLHYVAVAFLVASLFLMVAAMHIDVRTCSGDIAIRVSLLGIFVRIGSKPIIVPEFEGFALRALALLGICSSLAIVAALWRKALLAAGLAVCFSSGTLVALLRTLLRISSAPTTTILVPGGKLVFNATCTVNDLPFFLCTLSLIFSAPAIFLGAVYLLESTQNRQES